MSQQDHANHAEVACCDVRCFWYGRPMKETVTVRLSKQTHTALREYLLRRRCRQLAAIIDEVITSGLRTTEDGRAALKAAEVDL